MLRFSFFDLPAALERSEVSALGADMPGIKGLGVAMSFYLRKKVTPSINRLLLIPAFLS